VSLIDTKLPSLSFVFRTPAVSALLTEDKLAVFQWLFLQLVPGWSGSYRKELTKQADAHFKEAVRQGKGHSPCNHSDVMLQHCSS